MKEFYNGKKVLVTGGTGLIGRAVVKQLCELGAKVTSVSLDDIKPEKNVVYLNLDLRQYNNCLLVTRGQDYVFHLAGVKASPAITTARPATMSVAPLMVNTNILAACRENKVTKTLFTSSIGAYAAAEVLQEDHAFDGEPMDFLPGHVKRMAEYQIQGYAQEDKYNKYVIVRLANCYGPGDNFDPDNAMVIPSLIAKYLRGDNPVNVWGNGSARRDLLYSEDAARGILQAMLHVNDPYPVNLGSGKEHTIKEVADILSRLMKVPYEFDASKPSGAPRRFMDITKARGFGYNPTMGLSEGVQMSMIWFIKHPEEYKLRQNYFKERK